jgi:effector-binding domain-containing protein
MRQGPQIQQREAQQYLGICMAVTMQSFPEAVDREFPELFGWLARHGITPAGPPFIRYLVIDMENELQVELGVPVAGEVEADDRIRHDVLPAGRYVTLRHAGPYHGLIVSNATLQDWVREQGVELDTWQTEHYLTDPLAEPDPARWEVDVAYLSHARRPAAE